jgi:hypothetical protein
MSVPMTLLVWFFRRDALSRFNRGAQHRSGARRQPQNAAASQQYGSETGY